MFKQFGKGGYYGTIVIEEALSLPANDLFVAKIKS